MWTDEVVPIVRYLINDYSSPYTYTDDRLIDVSVISAHLISKEMSFTDYTITISTNTIDPDPSSDVSFINLIALKAACIISGSEAKTAKNKAVLVKDGPAWIDLKGISDAAFKDAKSVCDMFERAKLNYLAGNNIAGEAIMTPRTLEWPF